MLRWQSGDDRQRLGASDLDAEAVDLDEAAGRGANGISGDAEDVAAREPRSGLSRRGLSRIDMVGALSIRFGCQP
jgi:hypothetical protein